MEKYFVKNTVFFIRNPYFAAVDGIFIYGIIYIYSYREGSVTDI